PRPRYCACSGVCRSWLRLTFALVAQASTLADRRGNPRVRFAYPGYVRLPTPTMESRVSLGAIGGNGIGRPHPVDADRVAEWLGSRGRGAGDAQVPALSRGQRGKAAGV